VNVGLTFRTTIIALVLSLLSIWWIHQATLTQAPGNVYAPVYMLAVPPVPAVFCLLLLVALVPLTARFFKRALSEREMIVAYMFLVIAIPPATFGIVEMLIPWMVNPVYFQTPQDDMAQLAEAMPHWFRPHDTEVIRQMYEGSDDGAFPWRHWVYPLGVWTAFMTLVFFTGLCLVTLFRKQWVERERLRFPLLFIPMSIVQREAPGSRTSFFRNPLVWVAFGLVTVHHVLNVMHAFNPAVMALEDRYHLGQVFTEQPWTAYRGVSFFHRPQMVGLAYFVSLDVLFSGWFFFLLQPFLKIIADIFGLAADASFPFVQQQGTGAYIALLLVLFWTARGHLGQIIRKAFYNDPDVDDAQEPMPYRWALFGTIGGFVAIIAWTYTMGFSLSYSIPFFGMLIGFGLVYSRVRAEAGVPSMWAFPFDQHRQTILNLVGYGPLIRGADVTNLTLLTSFSWLGRGYFPSQMGYLTENEALADQMKIGARMLPALMMGAFLVGCVAAYYVTLKDYYGFGALVLNGGTTRGGYNITTSLSQWTTAAAALKSAGPANLNRTLGLVGGAVATVGLVALRQYWLRSPFHPLGYIATLNHGYALWAPFFTAWVIKSAIHRLGGARLFRQLMPFFLGLVMADLVIAGLSRIVMAILGPDCLGGYIVHFG